MVLKIKKILEKYAIDPITICIEITESLLVEGDAPFHDVLSQIRDLGVNFHVDDFGRGYSSLSYLQKFPVNTLKIDSSFTQWLGDDGKNSEIVYTIVRLAKALGMSVVAEGVENLKQLKKLETVDCQFVQGFYLSKPLKSTDAEDLIKQNKEIYRPALQ